MNLDPRTPLTNEEAYLAYKAGIIDDIPPRVKPMTRYQAYLAMWCGQTLDRTPTQPYTREEAYAATLAGVPNVLPDKARTRLQAYYEHIIKGDTPIPDYPITREEYYLSVLTKITNGPVSFEPNIRLETDESKIFGLNIYGNLEQNKYTGKNLLKFNLNWTSNGISVKTNKYGRITEAKGTMTASWAVVSKFYDEVLFPAGKYTFSVDRPLNHTLTITINYVIGSSWGLNINLSAGQTKVMFNTAQPFKTFRIVVSDIVGTNIDLGAFTPKLSFGDTPTDEPYIGDDISAGYKNMFNELSGLPVNKNGLSLINQDGVLKLSGTPDSDWVQLVSRDITGILGDKRPYTIIQYNTPNVKFYVEIAAHKKDDSGSDVIGNKTSRIHNFTTDFTKYDRYNMVIMCGKKDDATPLPLYGNFALYYGTFDENNLPEYTPYLTSVTSPRPQFPQVVKGLSDGKVSVLGKNLLKVANIPPSQSQTTISATVNPDGSITVTGENKNFWGMNFTNDEACPRIEKGTKVTMSIDRPLPYKLILSCWTNTGGQSFQFPLAIINAGSTSVTNVAQYTALSGHLVCSLSEIGKQINETFKIQLEYGDTATPFVPYESSEFTIPSGLNIYKLTDDIYDEVKLENGVAKLIKRVGKLILTGEENNFNLYRITPSGALGFRYYDSSRPFSQQQMISNIICSHFESIDENRVYQAIDNKTGVSIYNSFDTWPSYADKLCFWFTAPDALNLKITDVTSFKNWLKAEKAKGTPVTIYYEMKTPTEEEITNPTLLAELKKLMEMRTYKDVTNISITSTNGVMPGLSIKYLPKGATDIK